MKALLYKCVAALGILMASFGGNASARADTVSVHESAKVENRTSFVREISREEAQQIFRVMADQKDIAFRFVKDGCFARAYLMIERMKAMGLEPGRVWSFENGESLHVETKLESEGYVEWWYHVAPVLPVQIQGQTVYLVIDPSMFDRPVTVKEWVEAQRKNDSSPQPLVQITRLGKPVFNPRTNSADGSGYWPGFDPLEGVVRNAAETMERNKKLLERI